MIPVRGIGSGNVPEHSGVSLVAVIRGRILGVGILYIP